ncbi:hypothetical protein [Methylicorpusculum sp.]|uniref:hypothetical protein n=1 Tax=Methylicorpusculum sp. TaxID=2713644 RepID=UPI0027301E73|nr:hypothetical protein [Methylicorpusculum sp.]MDP2178680.1 hypothetical protein [Methylicorpusculum sp.]MDP3529565.1 hypothetical protein [Methylicorpusculum sp.]MDZ4154490.1 hypothetical protein [Methylicorpusculum sp.]
MTIPPQSLVRVEFLTRVVRKESLHLISTDKRLFDDGFTLEQIEKLDATPDVAERVEAFVGRFGRLQDTLGDKLLPLLLSLLGEKVSSVIDNLDRAERLGFINSTDDWMAMRNLRNQMVHEYVEDPSILHCALLSGHDFVPLLTASADKMLDEIERRMT